MSCILLPTCPNTHRRGRGLHLQCKTAPCRRSSYPRRVYAFSAAGALPKWIGWGIYGSAILYQMCNSGQAAGYWYYIPASAGKYIKRDIIIDVPHPSSPLLQYLQARAWYPPAMQNRAACPLSNSRRSLPTKSPPRTLRIFTAYDSNLYMNHEYVLKRY